MDEIHGDPQKKHPPLLSASIKLVSPSSVIDSIKKFHKVDSLVSIQLIEIMGEPVYQIRCLSAIHNDVTNHHQMKEMNHLANAKTGELRGALSAPEALGVAKRYFMDTAKVKSIEYLTKIGSHHEYRENPLPAYAVTFNHPTSTTVYIAAELDLRFHKHNAQHLMLP